MSLRLRLKLRLNWGRGWIISTDFWIGNSLIELNFDNELSIFTVSIVEICGGGATIEPPLNNAIAAAIPINAATEGITIPHIATTDSPLLLFL